MSELQTLLRIAADLRAAKAPALLATVVRTEGSTYRRPGARMLIDEHGWRAGTVSGGCLEVDLLETAWTRLEENGGRPSLITYDTRRDGDILWGSGTGCGGAVEVLLERLPANDDGNGIDPLVFLNHCQSQRQSAVIVTLIRSGSAAAPLGSHFYFSDSERSEGVRHPSTMTDATVSALACTVLAEGRSRWETITLPDADGSDGGVEVFVEFIPAPPSLVIFGTGYDAVPIVRLAHALGWHVTVAGRRGTLGAAQELAALADAFVPQAEADVGPETLALVMTHNYLADFGLLETLLPLRPRYLGLLGPAARRDRLLRDLENAGPAGRSPRPQCTPLHAPAGLDLGAESPEEIALAIVAEMQAVLAGRAGGTLRTSRQPIHPPAARGAVASELAAS